MLPAGGILEQARRARDPRFDGRFFVGVKTTGIYCRPVCPVKLPGAGNVVFFDSAAAASAAGYRPCLRCRPESSPGTPAWRGASTTVTRALGLINDGALDGGTVAGLCDRLGITPRHLTRLFARYLGASPKAIAQTRRLHFAKKLLDETSLPMTTIAMSAGYGSIRRFNDHFRQTYHMPPGRLRAGNTGAQEGGVQLRISYRRPCNFAALLEFFAARAIPGIETLAGSYRRTFLMDDEPGVIEVSQDAAANQLLCRVTGGSAKSLMTILNRVRRMFDTDAIPAEVNAVLKRDALLRRLVNRDPGLRIPGAFDSFEVAVRAIVGQQISVRGATTVMGGIAAAYGIDTPLGRVFPDAARLSELDPADLPMPVRRARAIRELARLVRSGELRLDNPDESAFFAQLTAIPGIGPWTAQYIALRARSDPDAFLHGDLVIKKAAASLFGIGKESELLARSNDWRPWRGYAGMHLWSHAARMRNQGG